MFHWEWKTVTYIALDYFSFTICSVAMMSKMAFYCSHRKILGAVGTWNIVDMHIHLQRWTWLDLYSQKIPPVIILWQYNMSLSEKNNFYWKKNPVNFEKNWPRWEGWMPHYIHLGCNDVIRHHVCSETHSWWYWNITAELWP